MCRIQSPKPESRVMVSRGLYRIAGLSLPDALHANAAESISLLGELHRKMGHISPKACLHAVTSRLVEGIKLDTSSVAPFCETCANSKIPRLPFPKQSDTHAKAYGDHVTSDIWGPTPVESIGKSNYMITFNDGQARNGRLLYDTQIGSTRQAKSICQLGQETSQ